jgi:hypothetical protein
VIEKYFDMSVIEVPFSQAFDSIGGTINGIETIGGLMLAQKQLRQ